MHVHDDSRPRPDWPTALAAGALAALAFTLRFGYVYGTGDHDDLLPPLLAALEPGLFATDAYVQAQADGWTVRTAFRMFMGALARMLTLPLAAGVVHAAVLVGTGAGVFALARALKAGRLAAVTAAVVAVAAVPTWTLGGNGVAYNLVTPEGIAWALVLPALVWIVRQRPLAGAALLGVGAWFHALAGGLALGAAAVAHGWVLWRGGKGVGRSALGAGAVALVGGAVAALVVGPALVRQTAEAGAALPDGLTAFALYAEIRFPHHLHPGRFAPETWLRFAVLLGLGWGGARLAAARGKPLATEWPLAFAAAAGALALAMGALVLGAESLAAARVHAFKLTVLVGVLACVGVGSGLSAALPKADRRRADAALRRAALTLPVAALALVGVGLLIARSPTGGPASGAAAWARAETPPEAVFATPPGMTGFRVPARRAVVASWKAVPFRADLAADWWARVSALSPGAAPEALLAARDEAYRLAPDAARREWAERFGARYALLPSDAETALPEAYRDADWVVVRLSP